MPKTELPTDLTRTFSDIARTFLDAESVDETLDRIVHLSVETVESCDFAGVSIVQVGGDITTPAASHDKAIKCDELQYQFRQGPCVSAIWDQETFESEDLTQERRWPKWAPRAVEVGAASLVSYRLFVKQDTLGALNLYARKPGAFDDVDRETGIIFASHAAVALSGAQQRERMDGAIVAAKAAGMLMGRRGITSEQAMDVLRRAALHTNSKLSEVAERIVSQRPTGLGARPGALTLPEQEERAGPTGDKGA